MAKLSPPLIVAVVVALLAAGLVSAVPWGELMFAVGAVCLPPLLLLMGGSRRGSRRRVTMASLAGVVLLGGGFVALLRLGGQQAERSWFGLPSAVAIQVFVMTLTPLLLVGWLFASDFVHFRPRDEDLERLRSFDDDAA